MQATFRDEEGAAWLRTGDVGLLDAAGALWLHGRAKDMVKTGGENVHAAEVSVRACVCMCVCMSCLFMYMCVCACVYARARMCVCVYVCSSMRVCNPGAPQGHKVSSERRGRGGG